MKPALTPSLSGLALAAALLAGAIPAGAIPAGAASLDAAYDVSLLGMTFGKASLSGDIEGSRYKLDVQAKLTGLVGGFTGLQMTFEYPDILRHTAGEVLTRFAAGGAARLLVHDVCRGPRAHSRYDRDGRAIQGPTVKDLEAVTGS